MLVVNPGGAMIREVVMAGMDDHAASVRVLDILHLLSKIYECNNDERVRKYGIEWQYSVNMLLNILCTTIEEA